MTGRTVVRFLRSDDTETHTGPIARQNADTLLRSIAVLMRRDDRPHAAYREAESDVIDTRDGTRLAWISQE